MGNERLARAIARIEQAAATLDAIEPLGQPMSTQADDAVLKAEHDSLVTSHESALADRDRTIAKLQADMSDISTLKDQEIARLRGELQSLADSSADAAPDSGDPAISVSEHQALQQKYDRLRSTAESTLTGLDSLITKAEQAKNG